MPNKTERYVAVHAPVTVGATAASNTRIPYGACASGVVFVTAASGATSLTWWVAAGAEDSPTQAYSSANAALTTTIAANRAYPIPSELAGAPFIVAQSNSGTASVVITTKS